MTYWDDERWQPADMRAKRKLREALAKLLNREPGELDEVVEAVNDLIEAHTNDLYDRVNQSGKWSPDY